MADLQTALRSRIITAQSDQLGTRVYWTKVPQGAALPYVRMQTISDPRPQSLQGYHKARVARVQVDVFSNSYGEARAISNGIIAAFSQPATVAGVKFGRTQGRGPIDGGDDTPNGFIHKLRTDLLSEFSII